MPLRGVRSVVDRHLAAPERVDQLCRRQRQLWRGRWFFMVLALAWPISWDTLLRWWRRGYERVFWTENRPLAFDMAARGRPLRDVFYQPVGSADLARSWRGLRRRCRGFAMGRGQQPDRACGWLCPVRHSDGARVNAISIEGARVRAGARLWDAHVAKALGGGGVGI